MEFKLLRLLWDYSAARKIVDSDYIDKLIDIVVNHKKINKYVTKLNILTDRDSITNSGISLASYNPFSKTLEVYSDGINEMLNYEDKYRVLFNDIEQIFYNNLLITQIILHELEHANQRRIIDTETGLEAEILKLSTTQMEISAGIKLLESGYSIEDVRRYILEINLKNRQNYEENYEFAPEERLAQIQSYKEIIETLSELKEYVPNLLEFEKTNWLENMLRGYEYKDGVIMPPTIYYLIQKGSNSSLQQFDWFDTNYAKCLNLTKEKYSLHDRMKFGLIIDETEYNHCYQTLQMSKKYNC